MWHGQWSKRFFFLVIRYRCTVNCEINVQLANAIATLFSTQRPTFNTILKIQRAILLLQLRKNVHRAFSWRFRAPLKMFRFKKFTKKIMSSVRLDGYHFFRIYFGVKNNLNVFRSQIWFQNRIPQADTNIFYTWLIMC